MECISWTSVIFERNTEAHIKSGIGSVAGIIEMVRVPNMFHIRALKEYLHLRSEPANTHW